MGFYVALAALALLIAGWFVLSARSTPRTEQRLTEAERELARQALVEHALGNFGRAAWRIPLLLLLGALAVARWVLRWACACSDSPSGTSAAALRLRRTGREQVAMDERLDDHDGDNEKGHGGRRQPPEDGHHQARNAQQQANQQRPTPGSLRRHGFLTAERLPHHCFQRTPQTGTSAARRPLIG